MVSAVAHPPNAQYPNALDQQFGTPTVVACHLPVEEKRHIWRRIRPQIRPGQEAA